MRFLLAALAITMIAFSCKNADSKAKSTKGAEVASSDTSTYTTIEWIDSLKDLGKVKFGETEQINFKFKNTGTYPLFVVSAVPGCGCTVTDFPKEAIAPGKEGTITAAFDTNKGHEGEFRKNVNVTTNTKGSTSKVLYFMGIIVKEGKADSTNKTTSEKSFKHGREIKAVKIS